MSASVSIFNRNNADLLSSAEHDELEGCEDKINKFLDDAVVVADALRRIRDKRLYRQTHHDFASYLQSNFGMKLSRAKQLIGFSVVREVLVTNVTTTDDPVILPMYEAQTRPLVGLSSEVQRSVWDAAVAAAGGSGPSGRQVADAVAEIVPGRGRHPRKKTLSAEQRAIFERMEREAISHKEGYEQFVATISEIEAEGFYQESYSTFEEYLAETMGVVRLDTCFGMAS